GDSAEMAYLELVAEEYVAEQREARTPEPQASETHVAPEVPEELEEEPLPEEEEPSEDEEASDTDVSDTPDSEPVEGSESGRRADQRADDGDHRAADRHGQQAPDEARLEEAPAQHGEGEQLERDDDHR